MSGTTVKGAWGCPDSTLVLPARAPRDKWLAERTKGVGGSDVSAITGLSKYATAYTVWLDKLGLAPERDVTQAMKMGNLLEDIVVQLFEEATGLETRRSGMMRSRIDPIMQVTPDRLVSDGGLLECKTSNGWLAYEWEDGQVPDHAELQGQHAMAVTGKDHIWVAGLLDGRDFMFRRIERDEQLISSLRHIERNFWDQYVIPRVAPPVNRVDVETLRDQYRDAEPDREAQVERAELAELRAQYEQAHEQETGAKGMKEDVSARVRQLAGNAEKLVDEEGQAWFTVKQNGNFSPAKFQRDHPDVAQDFLVPTEVLDTKKLAENHPELHRAYRARVLRTPKMTDTMKGAL